MGEAADRVAGVLGTAEELAAAMRGGGLGLPDRVQHKDFGVAAAAWGMLEVWAWPA